MASEIDSPTAPAESTAAPGQPWRATIAGAIGTAIEWFDYGLYGIIAGLVVGPLFFPAEDPFLSVLLAFLTFAVGFAARPLGGLILGPLGDRWGRKPVLILCVILMGVATFLMGLLPTYQTVGVWAPILLVTLRLIQGFGAGAELAGAITYVNESAGTRKGWFASFPAGAGMAAGILAIVLFQWLQATLTAEQFLEFGWRIPFLLSAILTVVAILLRRRIPESADFEEHRKSSDPQAVSMWRTLGRAFAANPRNFIASLLVPTGLNVTAYVLTVFGISFIIGAGYDAGFALTTVLTCYITGTVSVVAFGALADRIGPKIVMTIGAVGAAALVFPYFLVVQQMNEVATLAMTVLVMALGWGANSAAQVIVMPSLFEVQNRMAGVAISRELQGAVVAGPTPFVAAALVGATSGQPWAVAGLIVIAQVIAWTAVVVLGRPVAGAARPQSGNAS